MHTILLKYYLSITAYIKARRRVSTPHLPSELQCTLNDTHTTAKSASMQSVAIAFDCMAVGVCASLMVLCMMRWQAPHICAMITAEYT